MKIFVNEHWNKAKPLLSIITPVFNREKELPRTILSVEKQSEQNFEYILVNDGSTDCSQKIITDFMNRTSLPVMLIDKENGGVHTARLAGYNQARAKYLIPLDSDDELVSDAVKTFLDIWANITNKSIAFVRARAKTQDGQLNGNPFSQNINNLSKQDRIKSCEPVEYMDCFKTEVIKQVKIPQPKDVTLVCESIVFNEIYKNYDLFLTNRVLRIYHTETPVSYNNGNNGKKTVQICKNILWNDWYDLTNNKQIQIKCCIRYQLYNHILRLKGQTFQNDYKFCNLITVLAYLPTLVAAKYYTATKF